MGISGLLVLTPYLDCLCSAHTGLKGPPGITQELGIMNSCGLIHLLYSVAFFLSFIVKTRHMTAGKDPVYGLIPNLVV